MKQMPQIHFLAQIFDENAGQAVVDKRLKLTFKLFQNSFFCICLGPKKCYANKNKIWAVVFTVTFL